jgi:rhodanese-related sulfurtransferase
MTTPPSAAGQPLRMTASDVAQRLAAGAVQLVDVRESGELELARLPQEVVHLPLSQAQEWMERIDSLLERERPVAVLCHAGMRSWQFGCWLMQERGFPQVWNVEGGIEAWSREVDPSVPRY